MGRIAAAHACPGIHKKILLLVYCAILVGLVPARDEILLMVFDADNVFPAAGETEGASGLVEDKDVEVTVYRPL